MRTDFFKKLQSAVNELKALTPGEEVLLLYHNDADGLTSGFIVEHVLERRSLKARRYCLEKPYPEVLRHIFGFFSGKLIIIADFGSGMLPILANLRPANAKILLLDHHSITPVQDDKIILVNCRESGAADGSKGCSASTTCFLFAEALDAQNIDLAHIAVLGAMGDHQVTAKGEAQEFNKDTLHKALQRGVLTQAAPGHLEVFENEAAPKVVDDLNALGSFGYFRGGPDIALRALREGFAGAAGETAQQFRAEFMSELEAFLATDSIQGEGSLFWFGLPEGFSRFGVKTVGLVCEEILSRGLLTGDIYLAGFQAIPAEIPGLGAFSSPGVKVSMRVSKPLHEKMLQGEAKPLTEILPPATEKLGGFVDACHPQAAATTIPAGKEKDLVELLADFSC